MQRAGPLTKRHLPRAIVDTARISPLHVLSGLLLWVCACANEPGIARFSKIACEKTQLPDTVLAYVHPNSLLLAGTVFFRSRCLPPSCLFKQATRLLRTMYGPRACTHGCRRVGRRGSAFLPLITLTRVTIRLNLVCSHFSSANRTCRPPPIKY